MRAPEKLQENEPYDRKSCNFCRVVPGVRHWVSGGETGCSGPTTYQRRFGMAD